MHNNRPKFSIEVVLTILFVIIALIFTASAWIATDIQPAGAMAITGGIICGLTVMLACVWAD